MWIQHVELTSEEAEFKNEILHATWLCIFFIFAHAQLMRVGKTHSP